MLRLLLIAGAVFYLGVAAVIVVDWLRHALWIRRMVKLWMAETRENDRA